MKPRSKTSDAPAIWQIAPATSPPVQLSAVTIRSERCRASSISRRASVVISSENMGRPPLALRDARPEHPRGAPFKAIRADDDTGFRGDPGEAATGGAVRRDGVRQRRARLHGRADDRQAGPAAAGRGTLDL